MTTTLHVKFAKTVMAHPDLRAIVDFKQSFVGGPVGEGPVNATNWMECFHGPSECAGHRVMLCAAKNVTRAQDPWAYNWYDMVTCMDGLKSDGWAGVTYNETYSIPEDAKRCALDNGIDWDAVDACANGPQGLQLLHDSHFETMRLFAAHGGYTPPGHGYRPPLIPNIWIAGKQYNNPLDLKGPRATDPYAHLVARVCEAYNGTKPASCSASSLATVDDPAAIASLLAHKIVSSTNATGCSIFKSLSPECAFGTYTYGPAIILDALLLTASTVPGADPDGRIAAWANAKLDDWFEMPGTPAYDIVHGISPDPNAYAVGLYASTYSIVRKIIPCI